MIKKRAVCVSIVAVAFAAMLFTVRTKYGQTEKWTPFTAEFELRVTKGTGEPIYKRAELMARKEDGTFLHAGQIGDFMSIPGYHRRVVTTANGVERVALDTLKSVQSTQLPEPAGGPDRVTRLRDFMKRRCVAPTDTVIGTKSFNASSIQAVHVRSETTSATIDRYIWIEGGCLDIEYVARWKNASNVVEQITYKTLKTISINDPDEKLFDIPANYKEQSVIAAEREHRSKRVNGDVASYLATASENATAKITTTKPSSDTRIGESLAK
jgi:hypothetical protein